jgi:uncharacterized SAM-binding protein YcdF (DUF218 family)
MSALVDLLFSMSAVIVAMLIASLWVWRRPNSSAPRRFLIAVALGFTVASTYVVPFGVGRILVSGYRQFVSGDVGRGPTAIVVLGSAEEFVAGWTDGMTITNSTEAARIVEAIRVFRLISPEWLVSSGGQSDPLNRAERTSDFMRAELIQLGVPPERILLESTSRNTYEEAELIAPMLRSRGVQQLVLVTTDTHMRRAMGSFRAVGWNAVPAIVPDSQAPKSWLGWLLPSGRGLELSGEVTHELLGLAHYWWQGQWKRE